MAVPRPAGWAPVDEADIAVVAELLGRHPQGHFEIVLRHGDGTPRVLRNAPVLQSGRPMPTLYWLVSPHDRLVVSRLESSGAVRESEAAVDPDELLSAHEAYRAERDQLIPDDYEGHRPSAGVGGTRMAGGNDPVGRWVAERLAADAAGGSNG